jgi:hypothetical protein
MSRTKKTDKRVFVVAKCVGCGKERKIYAGEVASNDHPMCDACFMPMIAKGAGSE